MRARTSDIITSYGELVLEAVPVNTNSDMITSYSSHSEYLSQVIVDINTRHQSTIVEKNITIHDVVIEGDVIMPPNFTSIFNMTPSISDIEDKGSY